MAEHTPEPWTFDGPEHSIIVWAGPDRRVCFMTSDGHPRENARLICAAPDLLTKAEALLLAWHKLAEALPQDNRIEDIEFAEAMDLRNAVAKARGIDLWDVHKHLLDVEGRPNA